MNWSSLNWSYELVILVLLDAMEVELLLLDETIHSDADAAEIIRPFRQNGFDVQEYSQNLLTNLRIPLADQLAAIDKSIAALDTGLKHAVLEDHEQLTVNLGIMDKLETALADVAVSTLSILNASHTNLTQLGQFFDAFQECIDQSEKSGHLTDLCRRAKFVSQSARKIRAAFEGGPSPDWSKLSLGVREVETMSSSGLSDLAALDHLAADLDFIRQTLDEYPRILSSALKEAVRKQDLSEMGLIIDALLPNRTDIVSVLVDELSTDLGHQIRLALEMNQLTQSTASKAASGGNRVPGRTTLPSVQTTPALRAAFWNQLEFVYDAIYQAQLQIELLESVYLRRFDEYSMYSVEDFTVDVGLISRKFFTDTMDTLRRELEECGRQTHFQQQILENEYPRLLKLQQEFITRVNNCTLFVDDCQNIARHSILSFQDLFISRSLARLLDPVNVTFGDPRLEDVDKVLKIVGGELAVCGVDGALGLLICRNVAQTLRLMFVKLETLVANDGDATRVIGTLTPTQATNLRIVTISVRIVAGMRELLQKNSVVITVERRQLIEDMLKAHEGPVLNVVSPLLVSLLDSVEAILLTMQQEDFSGELDEQGRSVEMLDAPCSLYMRELQHFLARCQSTFISQLPSDSVLIQACTLRFARRVLELFVRHLMLVRPVGQHGRLKLAADCAQLEFALTPLNIHPSRYGRDLDILKNIRAMLFQTPNDIVVEGDQVGAVVPYSVALHLLLSQAPPEIKSPHQHLGWSKGRYSAYLDEHPHEMDRLALISNTLDAYADSVRHSGKEQYSTIYPLLKQLLQRGLESMGIQATLNEAGS